MKVAAKLSPIEKAFMPSSLTEESDPELYGLVRTFITQQFTNIFTYGITALGFWHFGLNMSAFVAGPFYGVLVFIGLIMCRMGYTQLWRYWFMTVSWFATGFATLALGEESFFWIWFVVMIAATPYTALEREKNIRRYGAYGVCASLAITLLLLVLRVIPPETQPEQRHGLLQFGMFTVVYSSAVLLFFVLRFYKETTLYKKRVEDLSVTMVQHAKMSSLGEMAAGVAHEINNPLGIIQGKIEGLSRRLQDPQMDRARALEDCEKVGSVVSRIAKIVSALRVFSKEAENDPFQANKMETIVNDILIFCSENLKNNQVDLRIAGNQNFNLECRPTQIAQVLVNMINNSFDAVRALPEKWIEINTTVQGDKARITVTDSGKGIPSAVAEKIMQPFFTTKEIGKGTGLGLSVSKGIIENHGGTIELDATAAHTRFVIELPLRQSRNQPMQKKAGSHRVA